MRKIPECECCLLYSHNQLLICAVHPTGPEGDSCLDFRPAPDAESRRFEDFLGRQTGEELEDYENPFDLDPDEELWQPDGASFYNGELILPPRCRWTPEEMMALLDTHPMFTGRCPQCERPFPWHDLPHWDCPDCGWVDDTI